MIIKTRFDIELQFLGCVCRLLKKFSLRFQSDDCVVSDYINLSLLLKLVLTNINIEAPSPAVQYWFGRYLDAQSGAIFSGDPDRIATRRHPGNVAGHQRDLEDIADDKKHHQDFIRELARKTEHYWFEHSLWRQEAKDQVPAAGNMLNDCDAALGIPFRDPLLPEHRRCSVCNNLVHIKDTARHPCVGASLNTVSSLSEGFLRGVATQGQLVTMTYMSYIPGDCTIASFNSFKDQLVASKILLEAENVTVTTQAAFKRLYAEPGLLRFVPLGMQHLMMCIISMAVSEALCESYGSVMEGYHNTRFFNTGPMNDDERLQREMYVKMNGPPMIHAGSLIRAVTDKMIGGVPYMDKRKQPAPNQHLLQHRKFTFATGRYLEGGYERNLLSETLLNLKNRLDGDGGRSRKGIFDHF